MCGGFGLIFTFVGMFFFHYVVELFPVSVRNAGVGLSRLARKLPIRD